MPADEQAVDSVIDLYQIHLCHHAASVRIENLCKEIYILSTHNRESTQPDEIKEKKQKNLPNLPQKLVLADLAANCVPVPVLAD